MADDYNLTEAIRLIKAGQKDAARALLEPFLLKNPNHIQAWFWETELFTNDREKIKVLETCLRQNPGNPQVLQALSFFKKRAETNAQPVTPKPAPISYSQPVYPEPTSDLYLTPEPEQPVSAVSPFSAPVHLSEPPSQSNRQSVPVSKVVAKKTSPKQKQKPMSPVLRNVILVGLVILACIALTGFYVGAGYYFNGQVNQAFTVQNCAEIVQQTTFVSLYPQAIFGSSFVGLDQYAECRTKIDMERAVEAKDWAQAFSLAQGYLSTYPGGTFAKSIAEQTPKYLSAWADEFIANRNYGPGIEKLKQLIQNYPNSPAAQAAPDSILQAYISWSKVSTDSQNYKDAEPLLKTALAYFESDPARLAQVKQELVNLYVAWGDKQVQQGDTENAVSAYKKAGDIDPGKTDVDLLVARANLQKAIEISKTKNFDKALAKVKEVSDAAQAENIKAEANATRDLILNAYSASTAPQAANQLNAAIGLACQGQRPELPIFGVDKEKARFGFANPFVSLPEELTAVKPGELHYVICAIETEDTIQKCEYQGGHFVLRIQYTWQMTIYNMLTGEVIDNGNIYGVEPKACPPVAYLLSGSTNSKSYGQRPTSEQIVAWLTKMDIVK